MPEYDVASVVVVDVPVVRAAVEAVPVAYTMPGLICTSASASEEWSVERSLCAAAGCSAAICADGAGFALETGMEGTCTVAETDGVPEVVADIADAASTLASSTTGDVEQSCNRG